MADADQPPEVRGERPENRGRRRPLGDQSREQIDGLGGSPLPDRVRQVPDRLLGHRRDGRLDVLPGHRLAGAREEAGLLDLLPEQEELRPDSVREERGGLRIEIDALPLRLRREEARELPSLLRRLALDEDRRVLEGLDPLVALVRLRADDHEHARRIRVRVRHETFDHRPPARIELRPAPLGLAHDDEPALGHHRQRRERLFQTSRRRRPDLEAVQIEIARTAPEDRLLDRGQGIVPQERFAPREQVGRSDVALRELALDLRDAHPPVPPAGAVVDSARGADRNSTRSTTRVASTSERCRRASSRLVRVTSMSWLAR